VLGGGRVEFLLFFVWQPDLLRPCRVGVDAFLFEHRGEVLHALADGFSFLAACSELGDEPVDVRDGEVINTMLAEDWNYTAESDPMQNACSFGDIDA
jgi:hypothetical protein